TVARSRARAGDCAGALPAFDAAIARTIEPTLRRDRGLCHEKLGDNYPAIDDYRAYLTARPEANDADQIRERLGRLEEQTGQGGPSAASVKQGDASSSGSVSASASASTSGSGSASARAAADKDYDSYLAQEKLADAAETSPLRYGTGWVIGPFVQIPTKIFSLSGQGFAPDATGYAVGATIRYSTGPLLSVITELGYAGIGTQGDATALGGVLAFLGGELRFPFSKYASDQIFAGGGLGFQRYVLSETNSGVDLVPIRARLGYRHVFGPSIGLDIGADLGLNMLAIPDSGDTQVFKSGEIGGAVAFLVAF
ncbi:MAG TPA: tetratricopeptide repeat protein, partial [Labilithrix sp.]